MPAQNSIGLLDADTPDTVRMTVTEAAALGMRALRRIGYNAEDAQIIVDHLVDNMLCGYRFTGLPRILAIAREDQTHDARTEDERHQVSIVHETPLSAAVNGGNNVGYIAAYRGAEIAIEKARHSGFSIVGVHNSYYSGRNAYYVEKIVKAGFACIHSSTAKPRVLPLGGARPALGPNPICFGFPSTRGPVVFDMATAALSWGDVMLHAHLGKPLPEGVGFDAEGLPTRDARQALLGGVGTFDGHKGFGLSFAVQSLGLLAGSALTRGNVQDFAFLFLVIDPKLMLPDGRFEEYMTEFVARIKATPRRPGVTEIRIPSERAYRERERRRKEGLVIDRKVVDSLNAL